MHACLLVLALCAADPQKPAQLLPQASSAPHLQHPANEAIGDRWRENHQREQAEKTKKAEEERKTLIQRFQSRKYHPLRNILRGTIAGYCGAMGLLAIAPQVIMIAELAVVAIIITIIVLIFKGIGWLITCLFSPPPPPSQPRG